MPAGQRGTASMGTMVVIDARRSDGDEAAGLLGVKRETLYAT